MQPRSRTRLLRTLIFVALGGLLVLAWTQRARFTPVDAGSPAPSFAATTINGEPFSIAGSAGKVIVLNVWATWCAPCRAEMPALERLHELLGTHGVEVVGVSEDARLGEGDRLGRPGGDVRAFVNEQGLTFRIVHDPEHVLEHTYLVQGLPTTFVIDKHGRIAKKVIGARVWDDSSNVAFIEQLLKES